MSPSHWLIAAAICAFIGWSLQHLPLTGPRRWLAAALRLAALGVLAAALWQRLPPQAQEQPQRVLYLVDVSASMDAAQREWIARRLASLEDLRPRGVRRALIAFAGDAQIVAPFGVEPLGDPREITQRLARAQVEPAQTNVEGALLAALRELPGGRGAHAILFSDGRETAGDATRILAHLRRLGLEVFPESVPLFARSTTVWQELAIAPTAQRGSPIGVQLALYRAGTRPARGEVSISVEGVTLKRQPILVRPGWQVVSASVPAIQQGAAALEVRLRIPEDGIDERRSAYTQVEGPPHLLVAVDQPTNLPPLAAALKRRQIDVSLLPARELPGEPEALRAYDGVLLAGVAKSRLAPEQAQALRRYVEESGGGLLVVGLGGVLAEELAASTPLDAALPVTYEAKGLQEAQRRVTMVMLIDRSASMMGPRLSATKRAAVELAKQLAPEDLVGVLAFDTQPYVVVEVQPARGVGEPLVNKLLQLRSSGGTDVYPALEAGKARLDATGATVKHLILLSDGNTRFDAAAYHALAASCRQDGVTISTIGIGAAMINTDYLQWVASATGGRFYLLRRLEELPEVIAQDTEQALGRLPFAEGSFQPTRSEMTDWFGGIEDWPPLRGFLTASAKPGAQTDAVVSEQPLLARWALGRGRVAAFLSDADTRWSPDWVRWPHFEGWWAQVARWVMRPKPTEEVFVWVDERDGAPRLIVDGALENPSGALRDPVRSVSRPLALAQAGRWTWEAPLDGAPSGWHELSLQARFPAQEGTPVLQVTRWIRIGTPPLMEERPGQPPRGGWLRRLASATGGTYAMPDGAFVPPTTSAPAAHALLPWWLPLVILLLLGDVAARGSSML